MSGRVVVIGSLNYDIILKQKALPKKGETLTVDSARFCGGGKGANQAVQCSKLGMETYMVGCVGQDEMGEFLRKSLKSYGVNTDYIRTCDGSSGMGIVNALEDGSVYASISRGANYCVTKADIDGIVPLLKDTDWMILQLEIPVELVEYAIATAKENNCKVLFNAAPAVEISRKSLEDSDVFIVNEVEAGFYTGKEISSMEKAEEEIQSLTKSIGGQCIFTLGKDGAVVCDGNRVERVPSLKVDAVETTGAGDSFVGGLAYAMTNGDNIFDAAKFATRCSAATVCSIGAQPAMPDLAVVDKIQG